MLKEFSYFGRDIAKEVVIYNTQKIADMIDVIKPIPDETYPPKIEGAEDDIRKMTLDKVHSILPISKNKSDGINSSLIFPINHLKSLPIIYSI